MTATPSFVVDAATPADDASPIVWQNAGGKHVYSPDITFIENVSGVTQIRLSDPVAGKGPFNILAARTNTFAGTVDPCFYIGYNIGNSDGQLLAGEAVSGLVFEADYNNGSQRLMETYFTMWDATHTYNVRPLFIQGDRNAASVATLINTYAMTAQDVRVGYPGDAQYHTSIQPNSINFEGKTGASTTMRLRSPGNSTVFSMGYAGTDGVVYMETGSSTTASIKIGNGVSGAVINLYNVNTNKPSVAIGLNDNNHGLIVLNAWANPGHGIVSRVRSGATPKYTFVGQDSGGVDLFGITPTGDIDLNRSDANPAISSTQTNKGIRMITNGTGAIEMQPGASGTKVYFGSSAVSIAEGVNITILGTTTGTKIGTSTTGKIGFFNKTPIVQPSGTPADATDLATAIALVNALKTSLVNLGLVA